MANTVNRPETKYERLQKGVLFIPANKRVPKPGDFISWDGGGIVQYAPAKTGIITTERMIFMRMEVDVVGGMKQEEADKSGIMDKVKKVRL